MEVTGKLKSYKSKWFNSDSVISNDIGEATIELPPVDVTKFQEGDKVWVECPLVKNIYNQLVPNTDNYIKYVAHFPKPKQEQEWCKCHRDWKPGKYISVKQIIPPICNSCGKIIKSSMEGKSSLEAKIPENLIHTTQWDMDKLIVGKINEIIDYLVMGSIYQPKKEQDKLEVKVPKEFVQAYSDVPSTLQAIKEKLNEIIEYLGKKE